MSPFLCCCRPPWPRTLHHLPSSTHPSPRCRCVQGTQRLHHAHDVPAVVLDRRALYHFQCVAYHAVRLQRHPGDQLRLLAQSVLHCHFNLPTTRHAPRACPRAAVNDNHAGKSTLTEKFLLYGGAIQQAGSVRARSAQLGVVSDTGRRDIGHDEYTSALRLSPTIPTSPQHAARGY